LRDQKGRGGSKGIWQQLSSFLIFFKVQLEQEKEKERITGFFS